MLNYRYKLYIRNFEKTTYRKILVAGRDYWRLLANSSSKEECSKSRNGVINRLTKLDFE